MENRPTTAMRTRPCYRAQISAFWRILSRRAEHTLSPGDMLYLPPGVAHHGVALDNCLTYSVGFRAPTLGEMISDLATDLVMEPEALVYRDPDPSLWQHDQITDAHIDQVQRLVQALAADRGRLTDWFARYVTRP